MVSYIREAEAALGKKAKTLTPSEEKTKNLVRKVLVAGSDLKKGEVLREAHVAAKRAGMGISPIHFDKLIGRTLKRAVRKNQIFSWKDIR
jgi:sialic acid synthase SpsE